jgi:hypothetical protein
MKKFRRKPKPYIEAGVLSLVSAFTKLCGLQQAPLVVFERQAARDIGLRHYKRLRNFSRAWGTSYHKANMIWISPNHETIEEARHTLAHEFIHFRFPYLSHGVKFEAYIGSLLKGESLGAYRPRKKPSPQETALIA